MTIVDDIGRKINLTGNPERVISLVPSITETVAEIGRGETLKGVTRFCVHPADIRKKATVVGGTKNPKLELIRELNPGLILAEKSENNKKQVLELAKQFPVFVFDVADFNSGLRMIETLGKLLNAEKAFSLKKEIEESFDKLKLKLPLKKALYLIWKKPWMAAGRNTFIGSMMEKAGFVSVVENGYPVVDDTVFEKAENILLSSEPYPFKQKDIAGLKQKYPRKNITLVDGEMFAWYGARMLKAAEYFSGLQQK